MRGKKTMIEMKKRKESTSWMEAQQICRYATYINIE